MSSTLSRYIKSKSINAEIDAVNVIIYSELPPIGSVVTGAEYILKDKNNQIVKSNGVEWVNVGGDSMEIGDIVQSAATTHQGFSLIPITNDSFVSASSYPGLTSMFNYRKAITNKPNIPLGVTNYNPDNCTSLVYYANTTYCTTNTGNLYKTKDGKNWSLVTSSFPGRIRRGLLGQLPWMIPLSDISGEKFLTWNLNQLYLSSDSGATWSISGNTTTSNLLASDILDINFPIQGANSTNGTPWIIQPTGVPHEFNIIQITNHSTSTKTTITVPSTYTINCIGAMQQLAPSWITEVDTLDDFVFLGGYDFSTGVKRPILYIKNLRTDTWETKYLTSSISDEIISIHYSSQTCVFVGNKDITIFRRLAQEWDNNLNAFIVDPIGDWATIPAPKAGGTIVCSDAVLEFNDYSTLAIIVSVNGESYISNGCLGYGITANWWDGYTSAQPNTRWVKIPGDYIDGTKKMSYSITDGSAPTLMHIRNDLYTAGESFTGTQTYEGILNDTFSIPGTGGFYDKIVARKL